MKFRKNWTIENKPRKSTAGARKNPFYFLWKKVSKKNLGKILSNQKSPKRFPTLKTLWKDFFRMMTDLFTFILNFLYQKIIICNDTFPLKIWLKFEYLAQKSNLISFVDILIVKNFRKRKDRHLRALIKKLSKSEDYSKIQYQQKDQNTREGQR